MESLLLVYLFILGAIVGSFLNVCIHRLPRDLSVVSPPSSCPRCNRRIRWYDNIPVVSYLLLGGKCRDCRAPISPRYAVVEILTGFTFAYFYYWYVARGLLPDWGVLVVHLVLAAALIAATFIDFDFRIIPDEINKTGIAVAPVLSFLYPQLHLKLGLDQLFWLEGIGIRVDSHGTGLLASLVGIAAGWGMFYGLRAVGEWIFKKEAMGLGDVKMMMMVGGLLGWQYVFLVFWFAPVLGFCYGMLSWLITGDRYMPYGPFLALATLVLMVHKGHVMYFLQVVYPDYLQSLLFR